VWRQVPRVMSQIRMVVSKEALKVRIEVDLRG
jgi:hypothetical protein